MKSSRLYMSVGFLIALAGIVLMIWLQTEVANTFGPVGPGPEPVDIPVSYRVSLTTIPLMVIALGFLIVVGSLILGELQARRAESP